MLTVLNRPAMFIIFLLFVNIGCSQPSDEQLALEEAGLVAPVRSSLNQAAEASFAVWSQRAGVPYRNVRYETLDNDGTFATVLVIAELRESSESGWLENGAELECRNVGGEWQCDRFLNFYLTSAQQQILQEQASATAAVVATATVTAATAEAQAAITDAIEIAESSAAQGDWIKATVFYGLAFRLDPTFPNLAQQLSEARKNSGSLLVLHHDYFHNETLAELSIDGIDMNILFPLTDCEMLSTQLVPATEQLVGLCGGGLYVSSYDGSERDMISWYWEDENGKNWGTEANGNISDFDLSPSGDNILFLASHLYGEGLFFMDLDSHKVTKIRGCAESFGDIRMAKWSSTDDQIVFYDRDAGKTIVSAIDGSNCTIRDVSEQTEPFTYAWFVGMSSDNTELFLGYDDSFYQSPVSSDLWGDEIATNLGGRTGAVFSPNKTYVALDSGALLNLSTGGVFFVQYEGEDDLEEGWFRVYDWISSTE